MLFLSRLFTSGHRWQVSPYSFSSHRNMALVGGGGDPTLRQLFRMPFGQGQALEAKTRADYTRAWNENLHVIPHRMSAENTSPSFYPHDKFSSFNAFWQWGLGQHVHPHSKGMFANKRALSQLVTITETAAPLALNFVVPGAGFAATAAIAAAQVAAKVASGKKVTPNEVLNAANNVVSAANGGDSNAVAQIQRIAGNAMSGNPIAGHLHDVISAVQQMHGAVNAVTTIVQDVGPVNNQVLAAALSLVQRTRAGDPSARVAIQDITRGIHAGDDRSIRIGKIISHVMLASGGGASAGESMPPNTPHGQWVIGRNGAQTFIPQAMGNVPSWLRS
jgi:hypothetical protein